MTARLQGFMLACLGFGVGESFRRAGVAVESSEIKVTRPAISNATPTKNRTPPSASKAFRCRLLF